ncbi:hypothetical protein [Tropicibacter alexandrii]|uniref:hypothetical protein n=1 Tax=Tropicibacter alexandrii TaxID=2267683 RepID=UPI0013E8F084|nr:hypothetical protein [Tropicibacter alexandrii]
MVEADRLIGGDILYTKKGEPGEALVKHRNPCDFRGSAVVRCQLPTLRFFDDPHPAA